MLSGFTGGIRDMKRTVILLTIVMSIFACLTFCTNIHASSRLHIKEINQTNDKEINITLNDNTEINYIDGQEHYVVLPKGDINKKKVFTTKEEITIYMNNYRMIYNTRNKESR